MKTESGIVYGDRVAIEMRAKPLFRVLNRMVRGLYYNHYGEILSNKARVISRPLIKLDEDSLNIILLVKMHLIIGTEEQKIQSMSQYGFLNFITIVLFGHIVRKNSLVTV